MTDKISSAASRFHLALQELKSLGQKFESSSTKFPLTLMAILENEDLSDIITWLPHGRGFVICDKGRFEKEVLPKYFKQSQYTSFTRRLNRWSFTIQQHGHKKASYFHPLFVRGDFEGCCQMRPLAQHKETEKDPEKRQAKKIPKRSTQSENKLSQLLTSLDALQPDAKPPSSSFARETQRSILHAVGNAITERKVGHIPPSPAGRISNFHSSVVNASPSDAHSHDLSAAVAAATASSSSALSKFAHEAEENEGADEAVKSEEDMTDLEKHLHRQKLLLLSYQGRQKSQAQQKKTPAPTAATNAAAAAAAVSAATVTSATPHNNPAVNAVTAANTAAALCAQPLQQQYAQVPFGFLPQQQMWGAPPGYDMSAFMQPNLMGAHGQEITCVDEATQSLAFAQGNIMNMQPQVIHPMMTIMRNYPNIGMPWQAWPYAGMAGMPHPALATLGGGALLPPVAAVSAAIPGTLPLAYTAFPPGTAGVQMIGGAPVAAATPIGATSLPEGVVPAPAPFATAALHEGVTAATTAAVAAQMNAAATQMTQMNASAQVTAPAPSVLPVGTSLPASVIGQIAKRETVSTPSASTSPELTMPAAMAHSHTPIPEAQSFDSDDNSDDYDDDIDEDDEGTMFGT